MNMTTAVGFGAAVALLNDNQPSLPTRRLEIDDFVEELDDEEF
jgi:hypothetical protein